MYFTVECVKYHHSKKDNCHLNTKKRLKTLLEKNSHFFSNSTTYILNSNEVVLPYLVEFLCIVFGHE